MREACVWMRDKRNIKQPPIVTMKSTFMTMYLAVVIALCSCKVMGWSMNSRMKSSFVCGALTMVIWQRQPKAGLIVHLDQGAQYASKAYRRFIKSHSFVDSMSKKGGC
jgi:putative transposase